MKNLPKTNPILNSRKTEDHLLPVSKDYPAIVHDNKNINKMKEAVKFAEFMKEQGFAPSSNLNSFLKQENTKIFVIMNDYRASIETIVNRVPVSIRFDTSYDTKNFLSTFDSKVDIYFQMKQKFEEVRHELETVEDKLRRFKTQNKCLSKTLFSTNTAFTLKVSPSLSFPSQLIIFKYSNKIHHIVLVFIENKLYMYPANIDNKLYMYPANIDNKYSFIFDSEIFTTYENVKVMMDNASKKNHSSINNQAATFNYKFNRGYQ
jgi:hypothetical protein